MNIGFLENFDFNLSYKKSYHLWDKKKLNFNTKIENIRKKKFHLNVI